ncbi:hypothetical protein KUCAC02_014516 [Chaenocephalus aceratus]|uniref:Uncharacterized protein n=1 Tax=Chaenocephalus aceratus TaxID=36190 RepID=A0ACB9WEZ0_CHAAC|nr:hypothetical protein KUCAC02_014516 [Chaenocephalus aceratus]
MVQCDRVECQHLLLKVDLLKLLQDKLFWARKAKEIAKSKVSRVKTFLLFMGRGLTRLSDWLFLNNTARVRGWSRSVIKGVMAVTTASFYLKNVAHFVHYLIEVPPRTCRLTQAHAGSRRPTGGGSSVRSSLP